MATNTPDSLMKYDEIIQKYSRDTDLPVNYIKAIIMKESGGDPNAVSPKGAEGLMQIMPGTQKDLGVTDPFDPEQSIRGGTEYLKPLYEEHGPIGAWGAYNMGPAGYRDALAGNRPIPQETTKGMNWLQRNYNPPPVDFSAQPAMQSLNAAPVENQQAAAMGAGGVGTPLSKKYGDDTSPYGPYPNDAIHGGSAIAGPTQTPSTDPTGFNPQMGGAGPELRAGMPSSASPKRVSQFKPTAEPGSDPIEVEEAKTSPSMESPYIQPEGSLNVPSPETNPGFWETIRLAAKEDPSTFYMILADAAVLNVQGIKHTMQQREQNLMAKATLRAETGLKYERDANRNIDRIRARAAAGGYLADFENKLGGIVDTPEEAMELEKAMSEGQALEKKKKYRKEAWNGLKTVISSMSKVPNGTLPNTDPWVIEVYGEENAPKFMESLRQRRVEMIEEDKVTKAAAAQRLAIAQERLAIAKETAKLAKDQMTLKKIMFLETQMFRAEQQLAREEVVNRELYNMFKYGMLNEHQETDLENSTTKLQNLQGEIDGYSMQLDEYAMPMTAEDLGNEGEAETKTADGGKPKDDKVAAKDSTLVDELSAWAEEVRGR